MRPPSLAIGSGSWRVSDGAAITEPASACGTRLSGAVVAESFVSAGRLRGSQSGPSDSMAHGVRISNISVNAHYSYKTTDFFYIRTSISNPMKNGRYFVLTHIVNIVH